jgi:hypothetical protein
MSEEELEKVKLMINTFGFYQAFEPIKEWFGWDDETTSKNLKEALN